MLKYCPGKWKENYSDGEVTWIGVVKESPEIAPQIKGIKRSKYFLFLIEKGL